MTTTALRARRVARGPVIATAARVGLAARAIIYLIIAWLAVQIARGHTTQQANQKGAVAALAGHRGGTFALWVLGIGLAGYALWRLSEAAVGTAADGRKIGPRIQSLARGIVYAGFAVVALSFVAGTRGQGQDQQQESATARLIKHLPGRIAVAVIGTVVIVVGVGMIVEGARRKFERQLRMDQLTGLARSVVVRLGIVGNIARGAVFALAGAFTIDAAVTRQPSKSTGLDGALRTLSNRPYGPWLLTGVALGLFAFGLYGLAVARWAKTRPSGSG
ncbi:MAG: DUF1206 domain-containing protein [Actinomycetota bacterium]|nr:DUF1206 domain-containing protein [Actinomycetota bacterium]